MFNIKPIPVGNIYDNTADQIARKIDRRMMNRAGSCTWAVGYDKSGSVFHIETSADAALFLRKLKIIGHYKRKVDRDWLIEDIQAVIGSYAEVA